MDFLSLKAVFFDYGGTLDANGVAWKEHFYPLYVKYGINVPQERFDRAFYDADDSLTEEGLESLSLSETLREQVGRVLHGLGVYDHYVREAIAREFFQSSLSRIRENRAVLERLQGRYRLGIISNNYGNLAAMCDETGLSPLMDILVDSNRVGAVKPDRKIFQHALDAAGVQPHQALMVGDSMNRDMAGARAMGMQHVLLAPEAKKDEIVTCCPGDTVISNLSELLQVLPA